MTVFSLNYFHFRSLSFLEFLFRLVLVFLQLKNYRSCSAKTNGNSFRFRFSFSYEIVLRY